ncbi:MAG: hypothetical protein WCG34_07365 [Leptolinea sp.]
MNKDLLKRRFTPIIAFIVLAALFLGQALVYIHQLPSTLDEGNYLYKGYLFVTGVIQPFQPYGVWTNKMPFAFLIPGAAQALFEPGLLTGRHFAILQGLITLIALWWFVRREAGIWWAAASVAVVSLNPGVVRMYSQALSEGLVACLLMTAVAIGVGHKRKLWQIIAGSILLAITVLTRENMLPIFGLYLIYLIFEHGWKNSIYAALPGIGLLAIIHAIYWPDIVTNIWMSWLPGPFKGWVPQLPAAEAIWKPVISFTSRVYSFWQGVRFHFAMLFGLVVLGLLPPQKNGWKDATAIRTILFLFTTVILMTVAHAWAALWQNYCVFCFGLYLNFFSILGVALIAITAPLLRRSTSWLINLLIGLVIILFSVGIGFGAHQELDGSLMTLLIPRIRGMQIQPGTTELWRAISNKFGYSFDQLSQYIPAAFGLLVGIIFLILSIAIFRRIRKYIPATSWGAFTLLTFFTLGLLLSPTTIFGNPPEPDCGGDVIASTETAGRHIASLVPPGSTIFWEGGLSPAPLLYVPKIKIFGAQLNDGYSYRKGGNSNELYKYGFWNEELSRRWMNEADYLLIIDYGYKQGYNSMIDLEKFEELPITEPIATCRDYSKIHIFKRIK